MSSSLFLKKLLNLTNEEYTLFSKVVNKAQWESFDELIALFPEDNTDLTEIRRKIKDYIDTPS